MLILQGQGAELNYLAVGDRVRLVNQVKPYREELVYMGKKGKKKVLVFN